MPSQTTDSCSWLTPKLGAINALLKAQAKQETGRDRILLYTYICIAVYIYIAISGVHMAQSGERERKKCRLNIGNKSQLFRFKGSKGKICNVYFAWYKV